MTRTLRAATVTLLLAATLSACGPGRPAAGSTTPGTAAQNRTAAGREADRLLTDVPLPSGAVPLVVAPSGLEGPLTAPAVDSLVTRTRLWSVPLPYRRAKAWFQDHPPAHLAWNGGGSGSGGPNGPTSSWSADAGGSAAWQQATAEVTIVGGDATSTNVRVDALVVWLDPTPVRDLAEGRRLRLTTGQRCPASDDGVVGVTARGADLDTQLLPAGRPTGGLVCTYLGGNAADGVPAFGLVTQRRLDAITARRLADVVAAVPLGHADGGMHSCPMDDGAAAFVALGYPGRADVDLRLTTSGCTGLANGRIGAAADTAALLATAQG